MRLQSCNAGPKTVPVLLILQSHLYPVRFPHTKQIIDWPQGSSDRPHDAGPIGSSPPQQTITVTDVVVTGVPLGRTNGRQEAGSVGAQTLIPKLHHKLYRLFSLRLYIYALPVCPRRVGESDI